MTARPLIILGCDGLAREMAQLARQIDPTGVRWVLAGFVGPGPAPAVLDGWGPLLGDDDWLAGPTAPRADLVLGVGNPAVRARLLARFRTDERFAFPNLVHPSAILDEDVVTLGEGNAIQSHCSLTCEIHLGDGNLLNLLSTVGHDTRLGDCNVVNPGANLSGNVTIADRVLIGTGSQLLEHVAVGAGAIVGAGAVVTRAVAADTTVVGAPAKPLERRTPA